MDRLTELGADAVGGEQIAATLRSAALITVSLVAIGVGVALPIVIWPLLGL